MIKLLHILTESTSKVLSKEFGGYNDSDFLKVIWKMPIEDVEELLKGTLVDLKWSKSLLPKGMVGMFAKRDIQIVNSRIKFLKQVIAYKQKDPNFIPDSFK